MTTIAWDGFTLAADKMAASGNTKHGLVTKIFRVNGSLVGITGSLCEGLALLDWFRGGADPKSVPDVGDDCDSRLVVITPEKSIQVYEVPYTLPIVFENSFQAFGSGRDFALAVMSHGMDARSAIVTASRFDLYTGGGVDTLKLA